MRRFLLTLLVAYFLVGTSAPARAFLTAPFDQPFEELDEEEVKSEIEKLEGATVGTLDAVPSPALSARGLYDGIDSEAPQRTAHGPNGSRAPPAP